MIEPGGVIPTRTLERVRALHGQIAAIQAQLDDILTAAVESQGHDVTASPAVELNLQTGAYTLVPRAAPTGTGPP